MNVRSLIKLKRFTLTTGHHHNADNPYTHKVEIWHGDEAHPYHETASFTKDELLLWLANISQLYGYLVEQIPDEAKDSSRTS